MRPISEESLSYAVAPEMLGLGEKVLVVTVMGTPVTDGIVTAVYKTGAVQIRETPQPLGSGGVDRIYDSGIYRFVPADLPDVQEYIDAKSLAEKTDDSAASRERDSEAVDRIDIDKLPADLKKQIKGLENLEQSQVDRIVSAVSDAALGAMKAVGVKDSDTYARVVAIQNAVMPLLVNK